MEQHGFKNEWAEVDPLNPGEVSDELDEARAIARQRMDEAFANPKERFDQPDPNDYETATYQMNLAALDATIAGQRRPLRDDEFRRSRVTPSLLPLALVMMVVGVAVTAYIIDIVDLPTVGGVGLTAQEP